MNIETQKYIEWTVTTNTSGSVKIFLPATETVRCLKQALSTRLGTTRKFRLLFRGRAVDDNDILGKIHPENLAQIEIFGIEEEQKTQAHTKINNVRLLKRNVDECAKCAILGENPRERIRYNDPVNVTPPAPDSEYMGNLLKELGGTFRTMSENLKIMAEMLKEGENVREDKNKYEINRRIVQNNMDSVRYANPMLLNLTKLRIPVNNPRAFVQVTGN